MKNLHHLNHILLPLFLLGFIFITGCSQTEDLTSPPGEQVVLQKSNEVVNVTEHGSTPPGVFGTSELERDDDGISFKLETTAVGSENANTLWLFIDENPAVLPGPPGLEPYEIRINVGGGFASEDGEIEFEGSLRAGKLRRPNGTSVLATDDGFFDDPEGAEILFIVRNHGERVKGKQKAQTSQLFGGCPPNVCVSIQEALHIP